MHIYHPTYNSQLLLFQWPVVGHLSDPVAAQCPLEKRKAKFITAPDIRHRGEWFDLMHISDRPKFWMVSWLNNSGWGHWHSDATEVSTASLSKKTWHTAAAIQSHDQPLIWAKKNRASSPRSEGQHWDYHTVLCWGPDAHRVLESSHNFSFMER